MVRVLVARGGREYAHGAMLILPPSYCQIVAAIGCDVLAGCCLMQFVRSWVLEQTGGERDLPVLPTHKSPQLRSA